MDTKVAIALLEACVSAAAADGSLTDPGEPASPPADYVAYLTMRLRDIFAAS